jgi:hypothetical protein
MQKTGSKLLSQPPASIGHLTRRDGSRKIFVSSQISSMKS